MALSEDLPLYRDSLRLLNQLIPLTQGFPRFFRYGLGNRMMELNLDMLSLIYKANSSYEKVTIITEFLDKYRMLQMLFRVCVEQRVITELATLGESVINWEEPDYHTYHQRRMCADSLLQELQQDCSEFIRAGQLDTLRSLLASKEEHLFHIMQTFRKNALCPE